MGIEKDPVQIGEEARTRDGVFSLDAVGDQTIEFQRRAVLLAVEGYLKTGRLGDAAQELDSAGLTIPRESFLHIAIEALHEGKLYLGQALYRILRMKIHPSHLIECGDVCYEHGSLSLAAEAYEQAQNKEKLKMVGDEYFQLGKLNGGLDAYAAAGEQPKPEKLEECGDVVFQEGNLREADSIYTLILKRYSEGVWEYDFVRCERIQDKLARVGDAYLAQGKRKKAQEVYARASLPPNPAASRVPF